MTIDGADARDFDDAISLERTDAGYALWLCILRDVTHYVKSRAARWIKRPMNGGNKRILSGAVLLCCRRPSNGICSLNQKEGSADASCIMQVDQNGYVMGYRFVRGVINVDKRVTL